MRGISKLHTVLLRFNMTNCLKRREVYALSAEEQMVQVESWLSTTPTAQGSSEDFCARHATKFLDT